MATMRELDGLHKELQRLAVVPSARARATKDSDEKSSTSKDNNNDNNDDDDSDDDVHCIATRSRFDVLLSADHRHAMSAQERRAAQAARVQPSATTATTAAADANDDSKACCIATRAPYKRLQRQPFAYLLVCDFEATCNANVADYPNEIIEFPVVALDTATLRIAAHFHAYVRPVRRPQLTRFCTELTGITQAMVDAADTLPVVLQRFEAWLHTVLYPLCRQWRRRHGGGGGEGERCARLSNKLRHFALDHRTPAARAWQGEEQLVCFATDGPSDMRHFMHTCAVVRDGVDFPPLFYRFVNVRHGFSELVRQRPVTLPRMLRRLHMTFEGRPHSGIDDATNIARVLAELLARGYRIHKLSTIPYTAPHGVERAP